MNKTLSMAIAVVAAQLAAYHLGQPDDCKCAQQHVGPVPADPAQQPENWPESPRLSLERPSAGSSSTVISAIGSDGIKGSDFSSLDTFSVS
jgi:hypothetical protein